MMGLEKEKLQGPRETAQQLRAFAPHGDWNWDPSIPVKSQGSPQVPLMFALWRVETAGLLGLASF